MYAYFCSTLYCTVYSILYKATLTSRQTVWRKPTETGRISCVRKEKKQVRALRGTRRFTESAQRRVLVVTIATRTQPRKGAHLAPLTPLTRAAHARSCIRRARAQTPLTRRTASARRIQSAPRNKGAYIIMITVYLHYVYSLCTVLVF